MYFCHRDHPLVTILPLFYASLSENENQDDSEILKTFYLNLK